MSPSVTDRDETSTRSKGERKRRTRWWLGGLAFVAGVAVGVLGLGLLSGPAGFPAAGTSAAPTGVAEPSSAPSVPTAVTAQVNEACLRALNDAQDVYTVLGGISQINGPDLGQIDNLVRALQPVEPRLRDDLAACRVDTAVGNPTSSGTPLPTTTPNIGGASPSSPSPTR